MNVDELIQALTELRDQRGYDVEVVVKMGYALLYPLSVYDEKFLFPGVHSVPRIVLTVGETKID